MVTPNLCLRVYFHILTLTTYSESIGTLLKNATLMTIDPYYIQLSHYCDRDV